MNLIEYNQIVTNQHILFELQMNSSLIEHQLQLHTSAIRLYEFLSGKSVAIAACIHKRNALHASKLFI